MHGPVQGMIVLFSFLFFLFIFIELYILHPACTTSSLLIEPYMQPHSFKGLLRTSKCRKPGIFASVLLVNYI